MGTRIVVAVAAAIVAGFAGVALGGVAAAGQGLERHGGHLAASRLAGRRRDPAAGGNAVDAAVAVGYALAVVNPCCGNLGGGGFATIRFADGARRLPQFPREGAACRDAEHVSRRQGRGDRGCRASSAISRSRVPGSVLGLDTMLAKYGTMSRAAVMAPAIKLAEEGFMLTAGDAAILATRDQGLRRTAECGRDLPQGRQAAQGRRPAGPGRSRANPEGDCRGGPDAFYSRLDRRADRRGEPRQWRHSLKGGFHRLHGAARPRRSPAPIAAMRSSRRRRRARAAPRSASSSTSSKATRCGTGAIIRRRPCMCWPKPCGMPSSTAISCSAIRISSTIRSSRLLSKDYAAENCAPRSSSTRRRRRRTSSRARRRMRAPDDALFDRRQGRQCGRRHDDAQCAVRRQGHRRRYRLLPQ